MIPDTLHKLFLLTNSLLVFLLNLRVSGGNRKIYQKVRPL